MTKDFDLALFGASGATGQEVLAIARERGLRTLAIDRSSGGPEDDLVTSREADVLEDPLGDLVGGAGAVISTLGVAFSPQTALEPPPLYSKGTGRIIEAMREAGTKRLCVISAAFVEDGEQLPLWFRSTIRPALGNILDDMKAMEQAIEAEEGLDWTVARPGWLLDKPRTGNYRVGEGRLPEGTLRTRHGDLAEVLVKAAIDGLWSRQKPSPARPESDFDESPLAVTREIEAMVG